ncbi:hypothetical protein AAY473_017676 [Plecturocebus cupreus]
MNLASGFRLGIKVTLKMEQRTAVPETDRKVTRIQAGVARLTRHVEQLVLDGDLRSAPGLCPAVNHALVLRMRLQIHKAPLHVVNNVCSIGWDLLGWELPVERDFGRQHSHPTRNHSLSVRVQVDNIEIGSHSVTLAGVQWHDHDVLQFQPPEPKVGGLTMLPRLVPNSWTQAILLPWPPKFHPITQAEVQWCKLSSLQPQLTATSAHCNLGSLQPRLTASWVNQSTNLSSCNCHLPDSGDSPASASWVAGTTEMRFLHVGQAGLELLTSSDPLASASQSAGITGMNHDAQPRMYPLQSCPQQLNSPVSAEVELTSVNWLRGDTRQRSHTGRQCDSFGRRSCFAGAPARRFLVRSIRDGRARLVPSPQGKQQLEALRTESFTASTANPRRSGSVGNGRPPKEN